MRAAERARAHTRVPVGAKINFSPFRIPTDSRMFKTESIERARRSWLRKSRKKISQARVAFACDACENNVEPSRISVTTGISIFPSALEGNQRKSRECNAFRVWTSLCPLYWSWPRDLYVLYVSRILCASRRREIRDEPLKMKHHGDICCKMGEKNKTRATRNEFEASIGKIADIGFIILLRTFSSTKR